MQSRTTGLSFQAEAVVREYKQAVSLGAVDLAKNIRKANPDLTTEFDKVDKSEFGIPEKAS